MILCRWVGASLLTLVLGCSLFEPDVKPLFDDAETEPEAQLWEVADPTDPAQSATQPVTTQPADDPDALLSKPYRLNKETIVRLVYHKSPLVAASRENMIAAQHGLEEFRANLSRFEPFARLRGDATDYPERRDSQGINGEVTAGLEKETFDGAVFRVEGGMSGERVSFGEVNDDQEEVEQGSGGLVRGRVEVPFIGSRKRQNRVISAAFQESSARGAVLTYLTRYRNYADRALDYYVGALLYLRYVRAYEHKLDDLNGLLDDERLKPEDRRRIESTAGDTKVLRDQYAARYKSYLLLALQFLGINPDEEYVLEEPPLDEESRYYRMTRTPEQRRELLAQAYENNPKFQVLEDAIKDSELKRSQAIIGKNDITAYAEGTQFAFGSETYDDRVGGWVLKAGVSFRRNDSRVLEASRKKAEAEIRKFRAQIEAEELAVQRQVAVQSSTLGSYVESRPQIMENMAKAEEEFEQRKQAFFSGESTSLTIDDVLTPLSSRTVAEIRLAANLYNAALAENALLSSTGEVYRMVGMEMDSAQSDIGVPDLNDGGGVLGAP
jgi:hypothetical protein